jgi:hypothetical protein
LKSYELTLITGGLICIGRHLFPALTAASLCLLEEIGSPLVCRNDKAQTTTVTGFDLYKALYIMLQREKSRTAIAVIAKYRFMLEIMRDKQQKNRDLDISKKIKIIEEKLRCAEDVFESKVRKFQVTHYDVDLEYAFVCFYKLLLQPGGFQMLHNIKKGLSGNKVHSFDADWLTGIVAQVSDVTNASVFDIKWRMPIAEASYYVVQSLRQAGARGNRKKSLLARTIQHFF